jgi:hypothetical protein
MGADSPQLPGIQLPLLPSGPPLPTINRPRRDEGIHAQDRWKEIEYEHTGFYESDHTPGAYSALLVQINQAGSVLVGWAVPPPNPIPLRRAVCFSGTGDSRLTWDRWVQREVGVVFVANLQDSKGGKVLLHAAAVDLAKTQRLGDPWYLAADPTSVLALLPKDADITGLLQLPQPGGDASVRRLGIQFYLSGAPGFEPLDRLSPLPRIPGYYGKMSLATSFTAQPFHGWVTKHSRPLPRGFLDDMANKEAQAAAIRDDLTTGDLGQAIQQWQADGPVLASERRSQILKQVLSWVETTTPTPKAVYRAAAVAALLRALSSHDVKVRGTDGKVHGRTYREWITLAYADEVTAWKNNGSPAHHPYIPAVGELGINVGDFLYTMTFATGDLVPLPKFLTGMVPEPGKYMRLKLPGFTIGFNPFYMNIKLERVDVALDSDGTPTVNPDGTIQAKVLGPAVFDTSHDYASGLIGVYLDVGTGWPSPGIDMKSLQILSGNGTLRKESFDGATFEIGQVASPTVSYPLAHAQGPASVIFSVSGEDRGVPFSLRTVVDVPRSAAWMNPESSWDVFKPLLKPAKMFKPSLNLFSGGMAEGYLRSGAAGTSVHQAPEVPERPAPVAEVPVTLALDDFFEVDSYSIPQTAGYVADFSRRSLMETALAEYRAILTCPQATRSITGWASPEGSEHDNLRLSDNRARSLAQAYLDAFVPGLVERVPDDAVVGRGEGPALEPPAATNVPRLQDPETELHLTSKDPAFPAAYRAWKAAHRDQVDCWPQWRRAELRVEGLVIISVGGQQQP